MELAFMLGLVSGLSVVLWAMRRDAPRHERVPVMSTPADWEAEGEGWKSSPEPEDTGAPGYYLPPPARGFGLGSKRRVGCPKCYAMNDERAKESLPGIPQRFRVRIKDGAVWCVHHQELFSPMPKGGLEAITVDKAA